jgi:hypothetical protein
MGPKYEMHPGTLKGMGREVTCIVGMIVGDYSHNSKPTIQNVPAGLPEGEYVFTFRHGSIPFRKNQGMWLEEV